MIKFFKLVEIQTKVASIFPFLLGNLWAFYRFDTWRMKHALIMLVSLLCIDMATTGLNNYMDYKKAYKKEGFNFETHNAIVKYKISQRKVLIILSVLIGMGAFLGLYLVYLTNLLVLFMGALAFGIGILYSFGPLPISRTPLGEIFSGLTMGFGIVFLSTYIHIYNQDIVLISIREGVLVLSLDLKVFIEIFLVSLPLTLGISNIMLANNICDIEDDLENRRYTLAVCIGRKRGLKLYLFLYVIALLAILLMVILKITPWYHMMTIIVYLPIFKMYRSFKSHPTKKDTFITAVKSFVLLSLSMVITLSIGIIF